MDSRKLQPAQNLRPAQNPPPGELREQAVALRRAGKSRAEIKHLLGISSDRQLTKLVAGEPPAAWSKPGSLTYEEWQRRTTAAKRAAGAARRRINEAGREATRAAAAAQIGTLTTRELIIAGAIAYWCEGAKSKPYRHDDHVTFVNSDPGLIAFFLRFLEAAGVAHHDLTFRVQIHENADAAAAQRFWVRLTGAPEEQFRRPTLKRHSPKTAHPTAGGGYHGCLRIDVRRSSVLYRRIAGWAQAAMTHEPSGGR